jgi:hypothetical protein
VRVREWLGRFYGIGNLRITPVTCTSTSSTWTWSSEVSIKHRWPAKVTSNWHTSSKRPMSCEPSVTGFWNEASLCALWTGVSSGTSQGIWLIAPLYDWLMVALVSDGPGGGT